MKIKLGHSFNNCDLLFTTLYNSVTWRHILVMIILKKKKPMVWGSPVNLNSKAMLRAMRQWEYFKQNRLDFTLEAGTYTIAQSVKMRSLEIMF